MIFRDKDNNYHMHTIQVHCIKIYLQNQLPSITLLIKDLSMRSRPRAMKNNLKLSVIQSSATHQMVSTWTSI